MATGVTLTNKRTGQKAFFPAEIVPELQRASKLWRTDAAGMADGGMTLTSSFVSYCELGHMQSLMDNTGQAYRHTAAQYASIYNRLFEIDF